MLSAITSLTIIHTPYLNRGGVDKRGKVNKIMIQDNPMTNDSREGEWNIYNDNGLYKLIAPLGVEVYSDTSYMNCLFMFAELATNPKEGGEDGCTGTEPQVS